VSFAAIILCVAFQRVFIVDVIYFVIDSVRKLLDTHSQVNISSITCRKYLYALKNYVMKTYGGVKIKLHMFLTSALDGDE